MTTLEQISMISQVPANKVALVVINPNKVGSSISGKYTVRTAEGKKPVTFTYGTPITVAARANGGVMQMDRYEPLSISSSSMLFDKEADKDLIEFFKNYPECGNSFEYQSIHGANIDYAMYVLIDPVKQAENQIKNTASLFVRLSLVMEKIGTISEDGKIKWVKGGKELAIKIVKYVVAAHDFVNVPEAQITDAMLFQRIQSLITDSDYSAKVVSVLTAAGEVDDMVLLERALANNVLEEKSGMIYFKETPIGTRAVVMKLLKNLDAPANDTFKVIWETVKLELN